MDRIAVFTRCHARARSIDLGFYGLVALAAGLRCYRPGLYPIVWDEVHLLFRALRLARFGDWVWLSNRTSWEGIPGHSPLNTYLLSLPYLCTTDPRLPRLLVAGLGTVAVALIFWTLKRYFGRSTAVIGGFLVAVAVPAIEWSRFVWNPNLAPCVLAASTLIGLAGYYEGKRWAQAAYWLSLGLAAQFHPANIVLALPAVFLLIVGWRRQRRRIVGPTLVGWLLSLLVAIPWIVGIAQSPPTAGPLEGTDPGIVTLEGIANNFGIAISGINYNTIARGQARGWWPPQTLDVFLWLQPLLTCVTTVVLVARARQLGSSAIPALYLTLVAFCPLLLYVISPIHVESFYMMVALYGAIPLQAIALGWLARQAPTGAWVATALTLGWGGVHIWLIVANLHWLDTGGWQQPLRAPLDTFMNQIQALDAASDDITVLVDAREPKYTLPDMQIEFWAVVASSTPIRIINRHLGEGIPFGPGETAIVGLAESPTMADWFPEAAITGRLYNGSPALLTSIASQDSLPLLDYVPETVARFDNGTQVLGMTASATPQPGRPWETALLWTPDGPAPRQNIQFSLRLTDAFGTTYRQQDFLSVDQAHWRKGDIILNPLTFAAVATETLPATPIIRVLMYTLADMRNAAAINQDGSAVADYMVLIPVR